MSRKAALKLSFAPDDYLATWQLPSPKGGTFEAHPYLDEQLEKMAGRAIRLASSFGPQRG